MDDATAAPPRAAFTRLASPVRPVLADGVEFVGAGGEAMLLQHVEEAARRGSGTGRP